MIPFLIGTALLIGSGIVIGVFWNEIKDFITKSLARMKEILVPASIAGFKTFIQTGSVAKALYSAAQVAIQKFYSKTEQGQWKETVVSREISFEDLPADIRAQVNQANGQEVDISHQAAQELKLERA